MEKRHMKKEALFVGRDIPVHCYVNYTNSVQRGGKGENRPRAATRSARSFSAAPVVPGPGAYARPWRVMRVRGLFLTSDIQETI